MTIRAYCCTRCQRALTFADVLLLSAATLIFTCPCSPDDIRRVEPFTRDDEALQRLMFPFRPVIVYTAAETQPLPQPFLDKAMHEMAPLWAQVNTVVDFQDLCATFDIVRGRRAGS